MMKESFSEYILKICPDFDDLDQIFGSKKNIEPTYIYDSGVQDTYCSSQVEEGELVLLETIENSVDTLIFGTPVPGPSTSVPGPSTSAPGPSTPVPGPSTSASGPSTPIPEGGTSTTRNSRKQAKNALSFLAEVRVIFL